MREELKIAEDLDCLIVPVGATGYMAQQIWKEYSEKLEEYYSKYLPTDANVNKLQKELKEKFDLLNGDYGNIVCNDEEQCNQLVDHVLDFIEFLTKH